jgi:hypothetical protein
MVAPTNVPVDSAVHGMTANADYWDAYETVTSSRPPSALHAYLSFTARTPAWIDFLMLVRNAAVRLLGLKDVVPVAPMHRIVVRSILKRSLV